MAVEVFFLPDEGVTPKLPHSTYRALLRSYVDGIKNQSDVLQDIEEKLNVTLTQDQTTDFNAIFTAIDNESGQLNKYTLIDRIQDKLQLAEQGVSYESQALLKAEFGWT